MYGRNLGGRVLLNGKPAQVISAQGNEIQVMTPKDVAVGSELIVEVEHRGKRSKPIKIDVVEANPAMFGSNEWGRGNAQARNEDGMVNSAQHRAARGSIVTLYTTGVGMVLPVEVHCNGSRFSPA